MTPLANERAIPTALNSLTLTNYRIRVSGEGVGAFYITSIMLEHLVSCSARKSTYGILLVLAFIAFIAGALITGNARRSDVAPLIIGLVVATILILAYFTTRQTILVFASAGGASVRIQTGNMEPRVIIDTIDIVESAIDARRKAVVAATKNSPPSAERQEVALSSILPEAAQERSYRIFHNGEDHGEMAVSTIRMLLKVGQLSMEDQYLNTAANEWQPLESLPDLV